MVAKEGFYPMHHPFGFFVWLVNFPPDIELPKIEYDGTTDPEEHLAKFNAHMLLYGVGDGIKCRMFPCTLKGHAIRWFFKLPAKSIDNFEQLSQKFLSQFVLSKTFPKLPFTLKCLKQGMHESLQDYLYRFNQEALQVDDLSEQLCIHLIQTGLKPGSFKDSLIAKPLLNLDDLWNRAACFVDGLHDNKLRKD